MSKILALWNLLKQGRVVANATAWKNRQITVTVLAGVILAIVNTMAAFGYSLPVDTETANAVAAGIIAVANVVLTVVTTDKIGITDSANEISNANTDN